MIDVELVLTIHDNVLSDGPGLRGAADIGLLEGALFRIDNWQAYQHLEDIFEIAALYAEAIAKAHAFPDGNKRTAMVTMLIYLDLQGVQIKADHGLDDVMVDVASGKMSRKELSQHLQTLINED